MFDSDSSAFGVSGQRVLVTGGPGEMTFRLAKILAHAGARVAIASKKPIEEFVSNLCIEGLDVIWCKMDVLSAKSVSDGMRDLRHKWGGIDTLIHDTQAFRTIGKEGARDGLINNCLEAELLNSWMIGRQFSNSLISESVSGHIIYIASVSGDLPRAASDYCVAKSRLRTLTKFLGGKVSRGRVRVNSIISLDVPIHGGCPSDEIGVDLDGAVAFLTSNSAKRMSGAEMVLDGGYSSFGYRLCDIPIGCT